MPIFTDTWINIGTDAAYVLLDNDTGAPVDLGGRIMEVDPRQKDTLVTVEGLDNGGIPDYRQTKDGWEIAVTVQRSDDNLELLIATIEANIFATGQQKRFTLQETINNGPGKVSTQFQYIGCVLISDSIGARNKKSAIEAKFSLHAKTRIAL